MSRTVASRLSRRLVALLAAYIFLGLALQAGAHTRAELDTWTEEWTAQADKALNVQLLATLEDMEARHPWYFDPQPSRPPARPSPIPGWSGSVESWRGLVSLYFPTEQVDRALCIMELESHGDPNALNTRGSSAAGLFQFLRDTWDRVPLSVTGGSYDSGQVYKSEPNVAAAAYLWERSGWWPWSPYLAGNCR